MNQLIKTHANYKIQSAVSCSRLVSNKLGHRYLEGKFKEITLESIYSPFLPHQYGIGTGKICNSWNEDLSSEIDLIIFARNLIPPFLFDGKLGIFPIESVLTCIEVKTTLTKKELKKTYDNFSKFKQRFIDKLVSGQYNDSNMAVQSNALFPTFDIFAYNYNFRTKKDPRDIFKTYQEIDPEWEKNPVIKNICVAGVGWWIHTNIDQKEGWHFTQFDNYNEVLGYLSSTINILPTIESSRGNPRIGHYIFDTSNTHRI